MYIHIFIRISTLLQDNSLPYSLALAFLICHLTTANISRPCALKAKMHFDRQQAEDGPAEQADGR